jgi:hypothetical protein
MKAIINVRILISFFLKERLLIAIMETLFKRQQVTNGIVFTSHSHENIILFYR